MPFASSVPRKLSPVSRKIGAVSPLEPKHAWWQDLMAWPRGDAQRPAWCGKGVESPSSYFQGVGSTTCGSSPQTSTCMERDSHLLGSSLRSGYSKSLGSSRRQEPSVHLEWATQVRTAQCAWIRDHRALMRPTPRKREPHKRTAKAGQAPIPPARPWEEALRDKEGLELVPVDWQERKYGRKKKEWNLQRLRSSQLAWRQKHDNWERRKSERSADVPDEVVPEDLDAHVYSMEAETLAGLEQPPTAAGSSNADSRRGSGATSKATSKSTGSSFAPSKEGSKRPSALRMSVIDDDAGVSAAVLAQGQWGNALPSGESSPSSPAKSEASDHGSVIGARPGLQKQKSRIGMKTPGGHKYAPYSSEEDADRFGTGNDSLMTTPRSMPSMPNSRLMSARGSVQSDGGTEVAPNWSELFAPSDAWTPSYVGTPGASAVSSAMCSHRNSAVTSRLPGDEHVSGSPIPEESDASNLSLVEERAVKRSPVKRLGTRTLKKKEPTIENWEAWRTDFPLIVLDILAEFYENIDWVDIGKRGASLEQLGDMINQVYGFPPEVIFREAQARLLVPPGELHEKLEVRFSTLPELLGLVKGTIERVEEEDACLLWSLDDLTRIEAVFNQHANVHGQMPVAQLFQAIEEIGFSQLDVTTAESQRWLAGVTQKICAKPTRSSFMEASSKGCISFDDLVRIFTAALKSKDREQRTKEFKAEQLSRREAGFLPMEMEDLRELHDTYLSVEVEGNASTLAQLLSLFQTCQVRELRKNEVNLLKEIIEPYITEHGEGAGPLGRSTGGGKAPFHVFMMWMKKIFASQIGDLAKNSSTSGGSPPSPPSMDRRGFAFAMLREEARLDGMLPGPMLSPPDSLENTPSAASMRRKGTLLPNMPHSRRGSESWTPGRSMYSLGPGTPAGSNPASRGASRSSSRKSSTSMIARRHGSFLMNQRSTSKEASSRMGSRTNSRSNSRSNSVARSVSRMAGEPSGEHAAYEEGESRDGHTGFLQLRGLPPQEAILARKNFRATSVDLTGAASDLSGQLSTAQCAGDASARNSMGGLAQVAGMKLQTMLELEEKDFETPKAQSLLASRTKKQTTDTMLVVSDAIAKLEALGDDAESSAVDSAAMEKDNA